MAGTRPGTTFTRSSPRKRGPRATTRSACDLGPWIPACAGTNGVCGGPHASRRAFGAPQHEADKHMPVIPAKAGIQLFSCQTSAGSPACAGDDVRSGFPLQPAPAQAGAGTNGGLGRAGINSSYWLPPPAPASRAKARGTAPSNSPPWARRCRRCRADRDAAWRSPGDRPRPGRTPASWCRSW